MHVVTTVTLLAALTLEANAGCPALPPAQISVRAIASHYETAAARPASTWFRTGQPADLMLSGFGFDKTGGALQFNHPSSIASDGTRLLLADRNNNRVLVWTTAPAANVAPDLVLGQSDFNSNHPGTALGEMNWPSAVSTAGGRVAVADTENDRILVWLTFPERNGQAADFALDIHQLAQSLVWNRFPESASALPDDVLTNPSFGTPRYITSDGNSLAVWIGEFKFSQRLLRLTPQHTPRRRAVKP